MKHYQIIIAILAVAVSFVSCGSSDGDETPTYVEPTYTQHQSPQWNSVAEAEKPSEKYPADLTAYIQLPDSMKAYVSNADELAAFCGSECRGDGTLVDGVWCVRIWGNVGDDITLKYYCATNKYMYYSAETLVFKGDEHIGTYDEPRTVYFIVEK